MPGRNDNYNLDNIDDFSELNLYVKDYFTVEFVSVPPDFDISFHLSLREQSGVFKDCKDVNLTQLKKISMAVACSPVFAVLNNPTISISSCMYFLYLMKELNLIVKSIPNPVRKSYNSYKELIEQYEKTKHHGFIYFRGQEISSINFIIVNTCQLFSQNIIDESFDTATQIQKYQYETNKKMEKLKSLD